MKRIIYLPLALMIAAPSIASAEFLGDFTLGLRTTHFAGGDKSSKFDEYRDMGNGLFGDVNLLIDSENYFLGLSLENPSLDDQSYELSGGRFGLGKVRFHYDELDHQLSRNALTLLSGVGSNLLTIPDPRPAVSTWKPIEYAVERDIFGAELTVDPQHIPFYLKFSVEQQQHDGIKPSHLRQSGTGRVYEIPMPVDYTTNNLMLESGYRSKATTAVLTAGYSVFDNDNDLLTLDDNAAFFDAEEYSTAADNYSYNIGGRLVQRLPMQSVLALKASYTRNISEADWSGYTTIASPSADNDFDGDIEYIRGSAVLSSRWSKAFDTRLFYNYTDRNNDSEEITSLDPFVDNPTNLRFEYDKHEAGLETGFRLNKANKLTGGYEFSSTNRNREDADNTTDHQLFAQLKNTSLDWISTKLKLEYMNRSSDSAFDPADLVDEDLINAFFTPFDYADKDRYKAKLAFDFYPTDGLDLGLSYALVYDDYNATQLGLQEEQRHEFFINVNALLPAKIRLNTYAGYEYTKSSLDSRAFGLDFITVVPDPTVTDTANNFNWNQETTYDFIVVGGSLTVPVMHQLKLVFTADHQLVDGNIDFTRSAAAGTALETIKEADDYYKTQLGAKGIFQLTDAWSVTTGYLYEKSNLDEWKYTNYEFVTTGFSNITLSGAGLDSDYEAHQVYMTTTFRF